MAVIESRFADIGWMDALSGRDTPLRRIDPRAKLLATLGFILAVLSFPKYEVAGLLPFFLYPVVLMSIGDVPVAFVLRRLAVVAPFAVFVGMFNPLLDRQVVAGVGPWVMTGGWLSFASILLRFALTVGATLVVVAGTGIHDVCRGLGALGVPAAFTAQVLFLYRYLFVLVDDGMRMARARALRSFGGRGMGMRVYGHMLGSLLLRTMGRAERIHLAMRCRGFDGQVRTLTRLRFGFADALFLLGWSTAFVLLRCFDLPRRVGGWILGAGT
ncbi:MAG: cobalt ECF transporter T component CbiQ [Verrucomicrobiae bacterium]|nr:cobalt ECF transporter T component CbiQ [Verrucomicrobiae bacterium]